MSKLVEMFPVLAREVARSLRASGHAEVAQQVDDAEVSTVRFDDSSDQGYIHVEPASSPSIVEAKLNAARRVETIPVETEFDALVDIDRFGRFMGIDVQIPGTLRAELKRRASS